MKNIRSYDEHRLSERYNPALAESPWDQIGIGQLAWVDTKEIDNDLSMQLNSLAHKSGGRLSPKADSASTELEFWFGDEKDARAFIYKAKREGGVKKATLGDQVWYDPAGGLHYGEGEDPAAMYESDTDGDGIEEPDDDLDRFFGKWARRRKDREERIKQSIVPSGDVTGKYGDLMSYGKLG